MKSQRILLSAAAFASISAHAADPENPAAPWLASRSMDNFRALLDRSPFSLPTAEEAAPGAERFFLTGAATINGEPVVFVLDKNTQVRHMLGRTPNAANSKLLEYTPSPDPKNMRARIRIEGMDVSVGYSDFGSESGAVPQQSPGAPPMMVPPGQPPQQAGIPAPPQPPVPPQQNVQQSTGAQDAQPPRRVIRRRVISNQPPVAPPQQGP
jgi:hypothetical protein